MAAAHVLVSMVRSWCEQEAPSSCIPTRERAEISELCNHVLSSQCVRFIYKFLRKTAERLEGTSEESEEHLSGAFEIASSLRKLLEDRENQYATLEGDCWRRELELGEVQRKLAAAKNAYSDILQARDAHIHQLENMLAQKQDEIQETQDDLDNLQSTIGARESHIRKLEYELKLKSEKECQKKRTLVSSLGSWASTSGQVNAIAGFKSKMHSEEVETLNHLYMHTKDAFKQGLKLDGCVSEY